MGVEWLHLPDQLVDDHDDEELPRSLAELLIWLDPPEWHAQAACKDHPEVNWFPERGQSAEPAKEICAECMVRDACLDYVLDQDGIVPGIWAGLSQRDRRSRARSAA